MADEPRVMHATVREAIDADGDREWHIECRMTDGQKGAFVRVDIECEALATRICEYLNIEGAKWIANG